MSTTFEHPKMRARGTVRVSLPAAIAYRPEALKKSIAGLVEQLGCLKCFSGADCFFTNERDFVVDPQGALSTHALNPQPLPPSPHPDVAIVSLAGPARYDIDKVFKAVDAVINIIGACPCHSGFDILYRNEVQVIGIDAAGAPHQFGGQPGT